MSVTKIELEKALAEIRKIEAHRSAGSEKEIRRLYKALLKDLKQFIGYQYAELSEEGKLTVDILQRKGEYARFLEEVQKKVRSVSPSVSKEITQLVKQTYAYSYDGMVEAVRKSSTSQELAKALKGIQAVTPEVIKRAVENPISGLTLSDTLEKYRQDILYDIKRNLTVGLANGDTVETMAKRLAESLDGDYQKAVRIIRTESHRSVEGGFFDAAKEVDDTLKSGVTGMRMVKTWRTMKDARVRTGKADHVTMEGQKVLADSPFILSNGAETDAPGQSGIAAQDINCRCYASYDLEEWKMVTEKDFDPTEYEPFADDEESFKKLHQEMKISETDLHIIEGVRKKYGYATYGYVNNGNSRTINAALRNGTIDALSEEQKKISESLARVISQNTLPHNAIFDRYASDNYIEKVFGETDFVAKFGPLVNDSDEAKKYAALFTEKYKGSELTEKGFVSTSGVPSLNIFQESPVRLRLYAKKGTHAYVTGNSYQSEVIFPPGTKYVVREARAVPELIDNDDYEWEDAFGNVPDKIEVYTLELICEVIKT